MKWNLREAKRCYPRKGRDPQRKLLSGKLWHVLCSLWQHTLPTLHCIHIRLCNMQAKKCLEMPHLTSSKPNRALHRHTRSWTSDRTLNFCCCQLVFSFLPNSRQERGTCTLHIPTVLHTVHTLSGEVGTVLPIVAATSTLMNSGTHRKLNTRQVTMWMQWGRLCCKIETEVAELMCESTYNLSLFCPLHE